MYSNVAILKNTIGNRNIKHTSTSFQSMQSRHLACCITTFIYIHLWNVKKFMALLEINLIANLLS